MKKASFKKFLINPGRVNLEDGTGWLPWLRDWHCKLFGRFGCLGCVLMTIFVTFLSVCIFAISYEYLAFTYMRLTYKEDSCKGVFCHHTKDLSRNVRLHDHIGISKAIINPMNGKVLIPDVKMIAMPCGEKDSLVLYRVGDKRGYFDKYSGKVVIQPKYDHAWVFSDGIASVEEKGQIKFIDTRGNLVFARTLTYDPEYGGHVFHAGHCIVDENVDGKYGLMDTHGETVMAEKYDGILYSNIHRLWTVRIGDEMGVLNAELDTVIAMQKADIEVHADGIYLTMSDNTMHKYGLDGTLIDDRYITAFDPLEYELEETEQVVLPADEETGTAEQVITRHRMARARLYRYASSKGVGLMTADGHTVTRPKYADICALGRDTYLCTLSPGIMEIVNGKGQKIR